MLLNLDYIEISNFNSFGREKTKLKLSDYKNLMMYGENGHGKSTLLVEALFYNWFGSVFRKTNVGDLINTRNNGGLSTKSGFSKGSNYYEIERNQKPNSLVLYKNGIEQCKNISNTEFQKKIEEIIGCNEKVFRQIAILDSTNFKPFLDLSLDDKRQVIDNIFGLDYITFLLNKIKKYKKVINIDYEKNQFQINTTKQQIETIEKINEKILNEKREGIQQEINQYNESLKTLDNKLIRFNIHKNKIEKLGQIYNIEIKKYNEHTANLQTQLQNTKNHIENLKLISNLNRIKPKLEKVNKLLEQYRQEYLKQNKLKENIDSEINDLKSKQNDIKSNCKSEIDKLNFQQKQYQDKIDYYSKHDKCDSCEQTIDSNFKTNKITTIQNEIKTIIDTKQQTLISSKVEYDKIGEQIKQKELDKNNINLQKYNNLANKSLVIKTNIGNKIKSIEIKLVVVSVSVIPDNVMDVKKLESELESRKNNPWVSKISKKQNLDIKINLNINNLNKQKSDINNKISQLSKKIEEKIEPQETKTFHDQLLIYIDKETSLKKELSLINDSEKILSVDGVRKYINERNLPYLNKYIKDYLDMFELGIPLKLNNKFEETISEKHRGALKYCSLSKGEKFAVNASILLAFLKFIENMNNVNFGFIILDEADSLGLDSLRKDMFFNILKNNINKRLYCISHDEQMKTYFDNTMKVQKISGFSKLIEG